MTNFASTTCAREKAPLVHMLTYCAHPTSAYGSLLAFDTLRTGFPTAEVEVWDNGSCQEVLSAIEKQAKSVGARFQAMSNRHYAEHLRWVLLEREHPAGVPLVLCDPDVIFWNCVEDWDFDGALFAGRLMPLMANGGTTCLPRLHPSLLFIPDVDALRREVRSIASRSFAWDPVGPFTAHLSGKAYFWDTLGNLYQALGHQSKAFTEQELNCYDHLFFGSHLGVMGASADRDMVEFFTEVHRRAAQGDHEALRGIWRLQQVALGAAKGIGLPTPQEARNGMLAVQREMARWVGGSYSDEDLVVGIQQIVKSIQPQHAATRETVQRPHQSPTTQHGGSGQ